MTVLCEAKTSGHLYGAIDMLYSLRRNDGHVLPTTGAFSAGTLVHAKARRCQAAVTKVPTDNPQHVAPQANSHSLCFAVQHSDRTGLKNMTPTKTAEREAHIQSTEHGASVGTQAILFGASPLRRKHADCADQPRDLRLGVVVVHGSSHDCVWQAPGLQAVQPCFN
jgi:hypothetical protein